ncbi:hypothetical protein [Bradyrhizobium sp. YR681]|uniref:hypothetical protein n=1 Tax=Bradyrhizobium sp. YR681 TaxID=1144344 RepID=UPI00138AD004|nr:hypothetical protein [Bradyrhizobium sp. YR681]
MISYRDRAATMLHQKYGDANAQCQWMRAKKMCGDGSKIVFLIPRFMPNVELGAVLSATDQPRLYADHLWR